MSRILITSALPYINGIKHLGTLAGSMLPADVYARFQRARGRETLYICATDEHGTPTELAAQKDQFREELLGDRRNRFFSAYMTKAKQKMKIDVNRQTLQRVVG